MSHPDRIEPRGYPHNHPHDPDYAEPLSSEEQRELREQLEQDAGERWLDRLEQQEMDE